MSISHEAIYRHIYTRPQASLNKKLIKLLVRKKTRRRPPKKRRGGGSKIINQVSIDSRPKHINLREEIGHWEGDLVIGKNHKSAIGTIVERKTGFTCHLIKMDLRMPQWDYSKINEMFDLKNGNYIIGGHSQGAKIASQFVYEKPNLMNGLFLLGTSHPREFDLSDRNLPTIKLYAEFDGLVSVPEVMENKAKLPKNTHMIKVVGGNHSQFGYLGKLLLDSAPFISLEEQQKQTYNNRILFMDRIKNRI